MNTQRQPNVRTSIERIPGEIRSSRYYGHPSTSFNTAFLPGPMPVATTITTGTSRPPLTDERPPMVAAT
jgi:hypothetical protein